MHLHFNLAGTGASRDPSAFVSFRLVELVLDNGPEQGSARAIAPDSVNHGGVLTAGAQLGQGINIMGVVNERAGLARRRMFSTLLPQSTESPLFLHLSSGGGTGAAQNALFRNAVDQVREKKRRADTPVWTRACTFTCFPLHTSTHCCVVRVVVCIVLEYGVQSISNHEY